MSHDPTFRTRAPWWIEGRGSSSLEPGRGSASLRKAARAIATRASFLAQGTRIVSYPNSGRTWLRAMFADLGVQPRFSHAQAKPIKERPAEAMGDGMARYTHRRILFLLRSPQDTAVSNYYEVTRRTRLWEGDLKTFLRHPGFGFARVLTFHMAWLAARDDFPLGFHFERYEEIRRNPVAALLRMSHFLGVPFLSREEAEMVSEANRFENLKRREESGELFARFGDRFSPAVVGDPGERKVREGRIGGYRDKLDAEDIAYCDGLIEELGYGAFISRIGNHSPVAEA